MQRAHILRYLLSFGLLAAWALGGAPAQAESSLPILTGSGAFNVSVTSFKGARFKNVVKQQYDFSCGSAAVATLLTYQYDRPTSEAAVFEDMYQRGDTAKIHAEGFSLLDMKGYLNRIGYRSEGFRIGLEKLAEATVPAIALINTRGYLHFVVIKGLQDEAVLVADPALGNKIIPRDQFERMWNGLLFVVLDDSERAKAFFNLAKEWQVRHKAPIGEASGGGDIGAFTLMIPGRNFF